MFIRKATTRVMPDGTRYYTYRIVETCRASGKSKQRTLLGLGSRFDLDPSLWKPLCKRIEEIISGRPSLFLSYPELEDYAQQFSSKILSKASAEVFEASVEDPDRYLDGVDINESDKFDSRSVGGEHVSLHATQVLQLPEILKDAGFDSTQVSIALSIIIARMLKPGSEIATWDWLESKSAIGELLGLDFSKKSAMRLYRISDDLIRHKDQIESSIYARIRTLFELDESVILYDLTNTFFEGGMHKNAKARRGKSKEKRSDAPLLTLGLVLDGSGFVKRSKVFAGNVYEAHTVQEMLEGLQASANATVVMDRGPATDETIEWLVSKGYRYAVISREKTRTFDINKAQTIKTAKGLELQIYSQLNEEKTERRLYCYSPARSAKEIGITTRFMSNFEEELTKLSNGLKKPRTKKEKDYIIQRIGRMKERSKGASRHYTVTITDNAETKKPNKPLLATSIHFEKKLVEGSTATHPGVYCLRTNVLELDDEKLWKTYIMLNDLEAVFRSLKSELGLRPVYHQTEVRCDGHLFITVLAYQCVQVIRNKLGQRGINESWTTIRENLLTHRRSTTTFPQRTGVTVHVRKTYRPETRHLIIYDALNIEHRPGGIYRTRVPE